MAQPPQKRGGYGTRPEKERKSALKYIKLTFARRRRRARRRAVPNRSNAKSQLKVLKELSFFRRGVCGSRPPAASDPYVTKIHKNRLTTNGRGS